MSNMKHILYISLLFVGYNIHAMDTSKSSEKAMIKKEIQDRYNEILNDFNIEVNEAALTIKDEEQLQSFLDRAYSPETEKELKQQAEAVVAASRLARKNQSDRSGMHHTSPEKPKFKKTLPSTQTATNRKKPGKNTPPVNRQLYFDNPAL